MKRSPLKRGTPLKRTAMKRTRKKAATPTAKAHMAKVAAMPCLVCGRRSTVHHVTGYADRMGRFDRDDLLTVPLCPMHHLAGHDPLASDPVSVERLGHQGFYERHGIDLLAEARRIAAET